MRQLFMFINKLWLKLRCGHFQLHTPGNVKIARTARIISTNKNAMISIGSASKIMYGVLLILDGDMLRIGSNCVIENYTELKLKGGCIIIGDNVYINSFCAIHGHGGIEIGNDVLIGMHVSMIASNHNMDKTDIPINRQDNTNLGIVIEDDVWIGAGARILDGVKIGQGAVVAAGAVVNQDVEKFTIVGGVPARFIKLRHMTI